MNKSVLIIGAGPAGLVAAKESLEQGLTPTVIEKNSVLGGVWAPKNGKTWHGMRTNLSHYSCSFSDFPWGNSDQKDFPTALEMGEYLHDYADWHGVTPHIQYNQTIDLIATRGTKLNAVIQNNKNNTYRTQDYDHVIVASGVFSQPLYPKIDGFTDYQGDIIHSSDYKSVAHNNLGGKNVLVVGGSFSGTEIASHIAQSKQCAVSHVVRTPMWYLKREFSGIHGVPAPIDLHKIRSGHDDKKDDVAKLTKQRKQFFEKTFGNPGDIDPRLALDVNSCTPAFVAVADHYGDLVKNKKITLHTGNVTRMTANDIVLDGNHALNGFDTVIFATGYKASGDFLSEKIQHTIGFDAQDSYMPLALYNATFHPNMPNISFNGMYRGPHFGVMELQARLAAAVFAGKTTLPDKHTMFKGVMEEMTKKHATEKPQFPYADHLDLSDRLANDLGVMPDWKNNYALEYNPYIPAQYRLNGIGAKPDLAMEQIKRAAARVQKGPNV